MAISATAALWFLPFVLPICFYVAFTDMKQMRITNQAVLVLTAIFVLLGLFLLPFDTYLWRLLSLVVVLVVGIALNAAGAEVEVVASKCTGRFSKMDDLEFTFANNGTTAVPGDRMVTVVGEEAGSSASRCTEAA